MGDTIEQLRDRVRLLDMIIERECSCDRANCREHFEYLADLKYQYECKIMDYEDETKSGD